MKNLFTALIGLLLFASHPVSAYAEDFTITNISPLKCEWTTPDGSATCSDLSLDPTPTRWMFDFQTPESVRTNILSGEYCSLRLHRASDDAQMDTLYGNGGDFGLNGDDFLTSDLWHQFGPSQDSLEYYPDLNFPYDTYYYVLEHCSNNELPNLYSQEFTFPNNSNQLTALDPAQVWLGKGLLNIGVKFDLLAEAYVGSTLVSSGQVNSVTGGPVTFNNATLQTIPFDSFNPVDFPEGEELKIKLSVRNACSGSLLNFGTARLWYNDASANSRFGATIGESTSDYFLRNNFALSTTAGTGPRQNIAVQAGARCSAFKSFGIWTITL